MGLGRLRVRGRSSVWNVLLLKVTGWNIFRAVEGLALKAKKASGTMKKRLKKPSFDPAIVGEALIPALHAIWHLPRRLDFYPRDRLAA